MEVPALPPLDGGAAPPSTAMTPPQTAPPASSSTTSSTTASINFDTILSELQTYQEQTNNLAIPTSHPTLARITDALTFIGFEHIINQRWEAQYQKLKEYKLQHGHCNVPHSHPSLGSWVMNQRDYYKLYENNPQSSPLTQSRYEQLKSINLSGVNLWEKRLLELKAYKDEHGHTDVPIDYPKLGVWVLNQRDTYAFNKDEMGNDRIDALDKLGFNWNRWGRKRLKTREDAWDAQFNKLQEFIKANGHSNISQHDKDNEKLGKWIKNQRYEYRKYNNKGLGPSRLGRDRIDKLNDIGFQWRLRPERVPWEDRFEALKQYKAENGHCRVPMSIPELGKWAKYQRDQYVLFVKGKKAKITQAKIDKLLSIGFEESLEDRVALGLADDEEGHQQQIPAEEDTQQQMQQQQMASLLASEGGDAVAYSQPVAAQHSNQGTGYWTGAWSRLSGQNYQA